MSKPFGSEGCRFRTHKECTCMIHSIGSFESSDKLGQRSDRPATGAYCFELPGKHQGTRRGNNDSAPSAPAAQHYSLAAHSWPTRTLLACRFLADIRKIMDATDIGMEAANKYLVVVVSNIMLWILQEYLAPFAPYSTLHLRALESSNPLNCEFL